MSYNSTAYNKDYYKSHCGDCYERGNGWEEVFARQAEYIVRDLNPKKTLDVGCAAGYLVEGLRDLGVEAYGVDVSEYALSIVRDDIKPFCSFHSATEPMEGKYDLVTCIEVLEHLQNTSDIKAAIYNMCQLTDTIIFSSTPFDFGEETHFSINTPGYWCEEFAANGFYHDVNYDCSYFAVQTMLFRRKEVSIRELIREYENKMFDLWNQCCILRDGNNLANARISDLDRGNIEHFENMRKLQENCDAKLAELKEECNQRVGKIKENHVEIIQSEYEKRELLERKFAVLKDEKEFLESELFRYMQLTREDKTEVRFRRKKQNGVVNRVREKFYKWKMIKKPVEFWKDVFDAEYYAENNPDVVSVVGTEPEALLKHFIMYGIDEGRKSKQTFSIGVYEESNIDVKEHCKSDRKRMIMHYILFGKNEGRVVN